VTIAMNRLQDGKPAMVTGGVLRCLYTSISPPGVPYLRLAPFLLVRSRSVPGAFDRETIPRFSSVILEDLLRICLLISPFQIIYRAPVATIYPKLISKGVNNFPLAGLIL